MLGLSYDTNAANLLRAGEQRCAIQPWLRLWIRLCEQRLDGGFGLLICPLTDVLKPNIALFVLVGMGSDAWGVHAATNIAPRMAASFIKRAPWEVQT